MQRLMETQGEFRESLQETDWAWLAGFIDGEGCLGIRRQLHHTTRRNIYRVRAGARDEWVNYSARVSVHNTHVPAMERAAPMMGGTLVRRRTQPSNHHAMYSIEVSARRTLQELMPRIVPYMIVKRELAVLILEFAGLPRGSGARKQELYERAVTLSQAEGRTAV